jgi:hypothetical protein
LASLPWDANTGWFCILVILLSWCRGFACSSSRRGSMFFRHSLVLGFSRRFLGFLSSPFKCDIFLMSWLAHRLRFVRRRTLRPHQPWFFVRTVSHFTNLRWCCRLSWLAHWFGFVQRRSLRSHQSAFILRSHCQPLHNLRWWCCRLLTQLLR